jgi:hypothetical protein
VGGLLLLFTRDIASQYKKLALYMLSQNSQF